jgi:hypothetical protein
MGEATVRMNRQHTSPVKARNLDECRIIDFFVIVKDVVIINVVKVNKE